MSRRHPETNRPETDRDTCLHGWRSTHHELQKLVASFRLKGDAFIEIVKLGRTEMQDAVPMAVGQEFRAFAAGLEDEVPTALRCGEVSIHRQHWGNRNAWKSLGLTLSAFVGRFKL